MKAKEERQSMPKCYSDGEVLDLIEDLLVNQFGQDEREHIEKERAFAMLEHISELTDLRTTVGSLNAPKIERIRLCLISISAALEFGSLKHAIGAAKKLAVDLGAGTAGASSGTLRSQFEQRYIARGFLYSGCLHAADVAGHERELKELLARGIVLERKSGIQSFELSALERKRLIETFDLAARWQEQAPEFHPNEEDGEICDVDRELAGPA